MAVEEKSYQADNRTGVNHEGPAANTPVQRLSATSIIGDRIENPQGEDLGKVDNIMVNIHNGQIEYVVVEFGAFLGVGGKLFAIPLEQLQLDPGKKRFILDKDKEYLKQSPGFDKDHWPDTNEHTYFDNVNLYYGNYLPPFP